MWCRKSFFHLIYGQNIFLLFIYTHRKESNTTMNGFCGRYRCSSHCPDREPRRREQRKLDMLDNFYYGNGRACSNDKTKQLVHVLRCVFIAIGPGKCASDCLETCLIDKQSGCIVGTTEAMANELLSLLNLAQNEPNSKSQPIQLHSLPDLLYIFCASDFTFILSESKEQKIENKKKT